MIYVMEAHASDAWQLAVNTREKILIANHRNQEERLQAANSCLLDLKIEIPALVDDFNNSTEASYTAWPDRLYVVDREGRIAYKSLPGPYGFKPSEVAATLARILP